MSVRLVHPISDKERVDVALAKSALSLAGIWLEGRDRSIIASVRLLVYRANEEVDRGNRLLVESQLLANCLQRAIETRGDISIHWTEAVRAISEGLMAGGLDGDES